MAEADFARRLPAAGAASLHEAQGRAGALDATIRPLWAPLVLAGPAFAVATSAADNLALHRAVAEAPPGVVIVAATGRSVEVPVWGSLLSSICKTKGVLGLITDGAVRDSDQIRELGFPVFCAGTGLTGPCKQDRGTIGEPIEIGGVDIAPGDWVVGGGDGVVAVPAERADDVVARAEEIERREAEIIRRAAAGESTLVQLGLDEPVHEEIPT